MQCRSTKFGTITAGLTAVLVVNAFYAKKLKVINPTNTPNECVVEEICLLQKPKIIIYQVYQQIVKFCLVTFCYFVTLSSAA